MSTKRLIRFFTVMFLVALIGVGGYEFLGKNFDLSNALAQRRSPRVILISLDGATQTIVDKFLANGVLPANRGLGLLKNVGVAATGNQTITPSLTAPSHIAMATGSNATQNDINSNTFHLVKSPFTFNISGFGAPIGGYDANNPDGPRESGNPTATPLWVGLRAAGKKVVTATFPGGDGIDVRVPGVTNGAIIQSKSVRTVDYTIPFGAFGGLGGIGFNLTAADFSINSAQAIAGLPSISRTSFSPVRVASLGTIPATGTGSLTGGGGPYNLQVAAIDTTNDNVVNYDAVVVFDANVGIVAPSRLPATGSAFIKFSDRASSPFYFEGSPNKAGTSFYLSNIAADLATVRLARYSAYFIPRPAESPQVIANVDDINNNIGFWAAQADFRFPQRANPGLATYPDLELEAIYQDQVKTFVDYQTKVAIRSIQQNPDADLVMTYIEQPDGSEHQYLLTDPRQPSNFADANTIGAGQDRAKVARYDSYVQFAYQTANNAVQRIIDTVGTDVSGVPNSNIIVVSDHGFSPFHTSVNINNLLANAGFNTNQVRAIISGPATNIYINLQGREPNGVVAPADYPALQKRIIETLQGFVDTNPNYTGGSAVPIFDKVYNRVGPGSPIPQTVFEASLLKQANQFIGQDTGDVFALLNLGYNFDGTQTPVVPRRSDSSSSSPVLSLPSFYGAHGFDPTLPEMQAIFFAAGPDFGRGNVGAVRNIDVAPTINNILKVNPAATVEGKAIKS